MTLAPDDPRHGTVNGYSNLGCRCDACRTAKTAKEKERGTGGYATDLCACGNRKRVVARVCRDCTKTAEHGTESRYSRGCRCDACRIAATTARHLRRLRDLAAANAYDREYKRRTRAAKRAAA